MNINGRRSNEKYTRRENKLRACEQRQHNADVENLGINPQEPVLKMTHFNSPTHCRAVKGNIILPKSPSSLADLIPCAEKPDWLNVGYTQMMDI